MKVLPLSKWIPNLKKPLVIAGPCSAESEEQVFEVARQLRQLEDVRIYRAGIWKPRTRPNSFEGQGEQALPWLAEVKKQTGLLTACEVANAKHVELALKHNIDVLWIGARTTVSPFAVQEIADAIRGTNIAVMVKNPVSADLSLWIGALERIHGAGITKLVAIHRGFSTGSESKYRNAPLWAIPLALRQKFPDLPMICDPSHITGDRTLVERVCQKAMDVDMDGLIIETHITPDQAWSDAAQQITPQDLARILKGLKVPTEFSMDRGFDQELEGLRGLIDRVDRDLIEALGQRMEIVHRIAEAKIRHNVTAFQLHRMDQMLKERINIGSKFELGHEYIEELFRTIHGESVKTQTTIMAKAKKDQET
jgi:chorismate mutase